MQFLHGGLNQHGSCFGVTFLDVDVIKVDGLLQVRPFLKPTSLLRVLPVTSAHPPSIHSAWLRAYFRSLKSHSSDLCTYREARAEALRRLRRAGVGKSVLNWCDEQSLHIHPVSSYCSNDFFGAVRPRPAPRDSQTRSLWVRLPYHPCWYKSIMQKMHRLNNDVFCKDVLSEAFGIERIGIAWCLDAPTVASLVRRF